MANNKKYYCGPEYSNLRDCYLELPFINKRLISPEDAEFISPKIFSPNEGHRAVVFLFENKLDIRSTLNCGKTPIHVHQDSIWNFEEELDVIYVGFENNYQKTIFEKLEPKIIDIANFQKMNARDCIIDDNLINAYISGKQIKKVGIMPNGSYFIDLTKFMSIGLHKDLDEIHFFHFEKVDQEFTF